MEQNLNNPINTAENNTNLKQQYNTLKQKIATLEKNNKEILEMYKAEEQRLIKSNEFLMQKNNPNNSKNIKELEAEVLKMRNDIKQLQNLMEPRNGINLIENDNASSKSINNKIDGATEEKIREEYLINYKNKLKTEFEKKLITKHQELINYCKEQNKKIKENNLNPEDIIDINEAYVIAWNRNNFAVLKNKVNLFNNHESIITSSASALRTSLVNDLHSPQSIYSVSAWSLLSSPQNKTYSPKPIPLAAHVMPMPPFGYKSVLRGHISLITTFLSSIISPHL